MCPSTQYVVVVALLLEVVLARDMMEECDVISVVTEFIVGRRFCLRYDGGARCVPASTPL
jgi:hypothetical protein